MIKNLGLPIAEEILRFDTASKGFRIVLNVQTWTGKVRVLYVPPKDTWVSFSMYLGQPAKDRFVHRSNRSQDFSDHAKYKCTIYNVWGPIFPTVRRAPLNSFQPT